MTDKQEDISQKQDFEIRTRQEPELFTIKISMLSPTKTFEFFVAERGGRGLALGFRKRRKEGKR